LTNGSFGRIGCDARGHGCSGKKIMRVLASDRADRAFSRNASTDGLERRGDDHSSSAQKVRFRVAGCGLTHKTTRNSHSVHIHLMHPQAIRRFSSRIDSVVGVRCITLNLEGLEHEWFPSRFGARGCRLAQRINQMSFAFRRARFATLTASTTRHRSLVTPRA
jgi:hypothetical protein